MTPARDAITPAAQPFPLPQVRLLDGICFFNSERTRGFLHSLESDRLLHNFRTQAGIASSAEPLGGWESPSIELRGHFVGHYLSGAALMSVTARDELLKAKAAAIVAALAKCQQPSGYLSAFPPEYFDRLKAGQKVWAPWYTIHKIMAGMLDQYTHCANQQALDAAQGMANWCKRWTDQLDNAAMQRVLETEHGGMNEVLANLYAVTGKREYLETAERFDHHHIFDPLADGRDELKGLHVNTQIPKVIGAARIYELTGDPRYRKIAEYFWRQVTEHRCYATGGTSNQERWLAGPDQLASQLSATTQECCVTYNMLKLTRHVFAWTADTRCADYYERAFFNGILGTLNPKDAMTMYYVPLASGYWKMFSTPRNSFWCCTGSGVETFSKLPDSIYFHDSIGLWVNQFIASQLEWPEKGLKLRQETSFPDEEGSTFVFEAQRPVALELRIRTPYWATSGMTIKVNGQQHLGSSIPGDYRIVGRTWKTGDKLEVSLPMSLHAHPMPDDPTLQALMYGPLVLAGELGAVGLKREQLYGDPVDPMNNYKLRGDPIPAPDLHFSSKDLKDWIERTLNQPLTFHTARQAQYLTLIPLNRSFEESYAVYWRVNS